MRTLGIISLGVILSLWITAGWGQDHPHDWIRSFKVPGEVTDCCGGADCVSFPLGTLSGVTVGEEILLIAVGAYPTQLVKVKAIYPSPPGSAKDWGCHTGCMFRSVGF